MFNRKQHTGHFHLTKSRVRNNKYIPEYNSYTPRPMMGSGPDSPTDVDYIHIKNQETNQIKNTISDILNVNESVEIMEYDINEQPALEETEMQIQEEGTAPSNHIGGARGAKRIRSMNPAKNLIRDLMRNKM